MRHSLAFLFAGVLILLIGCKKDKEDKNDANDNNEPKLLRSFKYFEGSDSLVFAYTYDTQNRISTTHSSRYNLGGRDFECDYTYNYNNNDTMPANVRIIFSYPGSTDPNETEIEYFFYDNSGKLLKDSIKDVGSAGALVYNFTYFTDYLRLYTSFQDTLVSRQVIQNGNIVSEKDTLWGAFFSSTFYINHDLSFDSHPNPFYKAGINRVLLYMPENEMQDFENLTPAFENNPTDYSWASTGTPGYNFHRQYTYTYDSDGYPLTVTINDPVNSETLRGYYYY